MASPFPGVDPYVEAQGLAQGFQWAFATYCSDALNSILSEHHVALLGKNHYLLDPQETEDELTERTVPPARRHLPAAGDPPEAENVGSTAMLEPFTVRLPREHVEFRTVRIEILRLKDRTPVTLIEILSPINKTGEGFYEYVRKRRAMIHRKLHLVELDLLLIGNRLPMEQPLPPGDFYALVSRVENRPESDVSAWTIRDPLPSIPIPLAPPDREVILDLAAVFATTYERGRYARLIDYSTSPTTVKKPADRAWAERMAKAAQR
jgi:Protein of unknown function (DUF4058)